MADPFMTLSETDASLVLSTAAGLGCPWCYLDVAGCLPKAMHSTPARPHSPPAVYNRFNPPGKKASVDALARCIRVGP